MTETIWRSPVSVKEAAELTANGAVPCAGGTTLVRRGIASIAEIIALNNLPLNYVECKDGAFEIGATTTFSSIVREISRLRPDNILVKALSNAASTPLRNLITIGGSIAASPMWSNVVGPLLALGAKVRLEGAKSGVYRVEEFIADSTLRKNNLITTIYFDDVNWESLFFSQKRTHFDYSAFNITMLVSKKSEIVEDIRLVVVGCKGKYSRLKTVEERIRGSKIGDIALPEIIGDVEIEFGRKAQFSAEYLEHLFKVELERGLTSLLKG